MPGKVSQKDLVGSYQRAQVFALPSFYEGLPLVIAEALACGCVVVCTDLPGVRDWLVGAVPDAPVVYVDPSRMRSVDKPIEEDLLRFEHDLACAIRKAFDIAESLSSSLERGRVPYSVDDLSWSGLASRILSDRL